MLFPSIVFLSFFAPIFLAVYFFLPWKNLTFFLFSLLFFYWGETKFTSILLAFILINYIFGLLIGRAPSRSLRQCALALGVAANCSLLFYYKYFFFLLNTVLPDLFHLESGSHYHPHLPLGISYFTFHGISYLVDVYRGVTGYSKSPLNVGLYISMFPHMVAGPIVRYHTIANALKKRCFTVDRISFGLRLFVVGLAQKILIANNVGAIADTIFSLAPDALNASTAWAGVIAYTLQIYFDFCGYTFMAIAIGIILGFRLPRNFRYPYFSQSITEFWRRWHISLSTWFRDYLYIPLGGNRKGKGRTLFNLFIVFFLCGLWHGAAYTFVAWGVFHGTFLVLERLGGKKVIAKCPRLFRHTYTMLVVMAGWVLFRADNIGQAGLFYRAMVGLQSSPHAQTLPQLVNHEKMAAFFLGLLFATPLMEWIGKGIQARVFANSSRTQGGATTLIFRCWRVLSMGALFILCYVYILAGTYSPFLYFRF